MTSRRQWDQALGSSERVLGNWEAQTGLEAAVFLPLVKGRPGNQGSMAKQVGYARVSTRDQNLDLQLDALRNAGVPDELIFRDIYSGAKEARPGMHAAIAAVEKGDTLVVWRLDRLGRNTRQLISTAEDLKGRGVAIRSLTEGIETGGSMGRLVYTILSGIAELEREVIIERTVAGMKAARQRGTRIGRSEKMTRDRTIEAVRMLAEGKGWKPTAELFSVSTGTLSGAIQRHGLSEQLVRLRNEEAVDRRMMRRQQSSIGL